jgi:hypothetical protein
MSGVRLCNGDLDRCLKVQLYRYHASAMKSELWGEYSITGNEIKNISGTSRHPLGKKSGSEITCQISQVKIATEYSFLDFLHGGMSMSFVVSIDFTGSNGNPQSPDSLHYINPRVPNQYEQAISSVGSIVQDYDSDKMFPVYGFGARIPPNGQVSHMFPANWNGQNPFVNRVEGILQVYKSCIPQVQLYGPTNFAPTIRVCYLIIS